jgi:prevent-host-death family protein
MKIEIGAYEAKTRLAELLQQVKTGKRFTITNRGKAVAELVPSQPVHRKDKARAVQRFVTFMREHPVKKRINIRELLNAGRM